MRYKEKEAFVREAFENFPEAALTLTCTRWNYRDFVFEFYDPEEDRKHTVGLYSAVNGLDRMAADVRAGKLPGLKLPANFLELDALGDWDGWAFDALAQYAIFGKLVYS